MARKFMAIKFMAIKCEVLLATTPFLCDHIT